MARFIENMDYDEKINEDFDFDWKTAAWYRDKVGLMQARENHNMPKLEYEEDILVRSDL